MKTLPRIITDLIWYAQINTIHADARAPNLETDSLYTNDWFMVTMSPNASGPSDKYVQQ